MVEYYGENYESPSPSYVSRTSTATTKTSVSSKYTNHTQGSEFGNLSLIIGVKLILAVITLIGGAILALCINVWMYKHEPEVPPDSKIFPGDDLEDGSPMSYCQYQNVETKLCLDDMQSSDTLNKAQVYLFHCHGFFATSQFFHHSKEGLISKPKNAMDEKVKDRMCLDVDDGKVVLNNCVQNRKEQNWMFYKSQRLYNTFFDKCIAAVGNREPVMLKSCSESPDQSWTCLEVDKNQRLFSMYYQERNLTYPEHSEL